MKRVLLLTLIAAGCGAFAALAYAWHGEIAPVAPAPVSAFERTPIEQGAALALIGDCRTCYTGPGGTTVAGFDRRRITSVDWAAYPILRFSRVPRAVEVHIVPRPGLPFLGAGEAAHGPTGAALGNAIRDASGRRLATLPPDAARIRRAMMDTPPPR